MVYTVKIEDIRIANRIGPILVNHLSTLHLSYTSVWYSESALKSWVSLIPNKWRTNLSLVVGYREIASWRCFTAFWIRSLGQSLKDPKKTAYSGTPEIILVHINGYNWELYFNMNSHDYMTATTYFIEYLCSIPLLYTLLVFNSLNGSIMVGI